MPHQELGLTDAMADQPLDEARLRRLIAVGRSLLSQLDLETVLGRVLNAARDLTQARYAALGILDSDRSRLDRFITVGIDDITRVQIGALPEGRGVLGVLISDPKPLRLTNVSDHPRSYGFPEHHPPMRSFLGVPILIGGEAFGNLYLTEKEGGDFNEVDEESVMILAEWAAIAIANARSVARDRLRRTMDASERERKFWARELHDETLQGLAALRVLLGSGLRVGTPEAMARAITQATDELGGEIDKLRALITELRPAALDELGLMAAIEALTERSAVTAGLDIKTEFAIPETWGRERLDPELESTLYRLVQEALTNVVKHARAERVDLKVSMDGDAVTVSVRDDGVGFDPATMSEGFGLVGMRERLELIGGHVQVSSAPGQGTEVRAELPVSGAPSRVV
jgi:two-component system, NarL family, sensor histidine kinase DevS